MSGNRESSYELEIHEDAYSVYTVTASSEAEARDKFKRGEWDGWRHIEYGPANIEGIRQMRAAR
jgi:hypothetical protein